MRDIAAIAIHRSSAGKWHLHPPKTDRSGAQRCGRMTRTEEDHEEQTASQYDLPFYLG